MALEKFSAQADSKLLKEIRALADSEGIKLYALINEAFDNFLENRKQSRPRKEVMSRFEESLEEYDYLYDRLSK